MKLYHPHTYHKLGFDQILAHTAQWLSNPEAKARLETLQPTADPDILFLELQRVKEFKEIFEFDDPMPGDHYVSLDRISAKLSTEGDWLSSRELNQLLNWLKTVKVVRTYLQSRRERYPGLFQLVHELPFSQQTISMVDRVLDRHGNIADDASEELGRVRKQLVSSSDALRQTLQRIMRKAVEKNWTQDKEITIRNDRMVIPVKAESKGNLNGFVHDISQSGGTVYVEPAEALNLNNKLRELQIQEYNEMVRILREVTAKLRVHQPEIEGFRVVMIRLELIRAKAKLALQLHAYLPQIDLTTKTLRLRQAYYPPLWLKLQVNTKEKKEIVPFNLELNPSKRIMVISGPNAGGKSVTLKAIGLLQLMLQSGFLIPVEETSVFPLFKSLFLEIGDEQSIEADLSTYTSRLFYWRQMGDKLDADSLFLIDEFGSGTDPKQGGAIAESFLDRFVNQQSTGVITTHYGNLKDYAEITSGVINGAMQFDTAELKPTYMLMEGVPGRSYAFEMAKRVGVHPTILRRARKRLGTEEMDTERLLVELEKKNTELKRSLTDIKRKEQQLDLMIKKNELQDETLQLKKKYVLKEAKEEARQIIQKANKDVERTIREIREAQAEKELTRKLRKELIEQMPEEQPNLPAPPPARAKIRKKKKAVTEPQQERIVVLEGKPGDGDWVKLRRAETHGKLVEIQGNKGLVEAGGIRLQVKLSDLVKIKAPKERPNANNLSLVNDLPMKSARMEIDVMGKRAEEAIKEVVKFVDEARFAGLRRIRILHGKGTGALREAIRSYLMKLDFVVSAKDAPVDDGGAGWTIVEMQP